MDGVADPGNNGARRAADAAATEAAVAERCWANALKREDHFASRCLMGQTRVSLESAETDETLVLFEEWTAVSLRLPHSAPRLDVYARVSFEANRCWPVDARLSLLDPERRSYATGVAI